MKWKKLGKIFEPDGSIEWMATHAGVPFVDRISEDRLRVYFTARNADNVSHVANIVVDGDFNVVEVDDRPVLAPGALGLFDENGVTASYLLDVGTKKYMYYVGWNQATSTRFRNAIGLAISEDGEHYEKFSEGPIVDRSPVDPSFVAGTCVMHDEGIFKMWYISCVRWELHKGEPRHYYHLKYATSKDGIEWQRDGIVAVDFKSPYEYAISQPWVLKENGVFKMWYSYRGQKDIATYRIGYAESTNGIDWIRKDDDAGIDVSDSGWDSEMICYPYIFDQGGKRYMLYNGNHYGGTGVGLAVLED